jgi:hypothetical protein
MNKLERHIELSGKIYEMGQSLCREGDISGDETVLNIGNFMIFFSNLMYNEKDMNFFAEICEMYTAKRLLEENSNLDLIASLSIEQINKIIDYCDDKDFNNDIENEGDDNET